MIFLTFFKTLEGKEVIVELKNDLIVKGKLLSVDQFLNMKLDSISVVDAGQFPQLLSMKSIFVRGNSVRYIQVPPEAVDTELLQDAARREAMEAGKGGRK